tara:strand:+ start:789 stop:1349 length:561 start_codon:yes stop_codon:yes gene_type:complete
MIENMFCIDIVLFNFINNTLSNPVFDSIMPLFHHKIIFIPLVFIPWIILIYFDKKNNWKLFFLIIFIIILCDQTGLFLKKYFLRPRPWVYFDQDQINLLVLKKGENYSFPSNHAANITGISIILSNIYNKYKNVFVLFFGIIIFSRIYIGVHYPSDILFGIFIGTFYGMVLIKIWDYLNNITIFSK